MATATERGGCRGPEGADDSLVPGRSRGGDRRQTAQRDESRLSHLSTRYKKTHIGTAATITEAPDLLYPKTWNRSQSTELTDGLCNDQENGPRLKDLLTDSLQHPFLIAFPTRITTVIYGFLMWS